MSWDEKARQNAVWCGFNSMTLGVTEAKNVQNVYAQGAQWQRDTMRSPEVLGRVKDTLDDLDDWYGVSNAEKAKAILSSLLEQEPRP